MNKIINILIFILISFFPFKEPVTNDIPDHNENYYLDELGVLSEESKEKINNQNLPNGAQIFVLTVDNIDEDPSSYSVRVYEKYKLGNKERDNGLLILLARTSKGKYHLRVVTGTGLQAIFPHKSVRRIMDNHMMGKINKKSADFILMNGFNAFRRILEDTKGGTDTSFKTMVFARTAVDAEEFAGALKELSPHMPKILRNLAILYILYFVFIKKPWRKNKNIALSNEQENKDISITEEPKENDTYNKDLIDREVDLNGLSFLKDINKKYDKNTTRHLMKKIEDDDAFSK